MANIRKERLSRTRKLTPQIESYISDKMRSEQWSPEQIKGYAEANGIPMVSHESIYKLIQSRQRKWWRSLQKLSPQAQASGATSRW